MPLPAPACQPGALSNMFHGVVHTRAGAGQTRWQQLGIVDHGVSHPQQTDVVLVQSSDEVLVVDDLLHLSDLRCVLVVDVEEAAHQEEARGWTGDGAVSRRHGPA